MKPYLEKIVIDANNSWALHLEDRVDNMPFEWHHHPELELTLTINSRGHRYVGDSIERYEDGDLVLLGANVPHTWCSNEKIDPELPFMVRVCWFSETWISDLLRLFPELRRLKPLMKKARSGIVFSAKTATTVRPLMEKLKSQREDERLISLLTILRCLSLDTNYRTLIVSDRKQDIEPEPRLAAVFDYLHKFYTEPISIEELAEMAFMSPAAFHRNFRRQTKTTPFGYVSRLKLGRASALLIEGELRINAIASTVGYASLAQFNKEFKRLKGMTPREFALQYRG
ncbi:helix-turn-helix domain-containing protein [Candidatus Obscuribacterales bacterium]|nr:helix-turn-helix domain-containing protein [Candidatus Obscuribacterales bacterium]